MDDNLFSLPVKNGIISKEESVASLRFIRVHTVQVYKTLTPEEAIIERFMKVKNEGRQSLLVHFSQEQNFQQQQPFLPVQPHSLAQHQQQLDIKQQPQLALHNDVNRGSLFWSSYSPAEAKIACYTTPGGNNNFDDIRTVFAPDGVCFVENNGMRILNKLNVPVRRGEKVLLYHFSK